MESEEIIRAYMLEPGDIFKLGAALFRVSKIQSGRIYYHRYSFEYVNDKSSRTCGKVESMGANSREKLILVTNKTKQNEH